MRAPAEDPRVADERQGVSVPGPAKKDSGEARPERRFPTVASATLVLIAGAALFGPLLVPHSFAEGSLLDRLQPPVWMEDGTLIHVLGTDGQGRDILSRLLYGGRTSLILGFVGVIITASVGTLLGMLAGLRGGLLDSVLMRASEIALAIPAILIGVMLATIYSPSIQNVVIVILAALWPHYARLVRGETLVQKQQDYVRLARVAGCTNTTIMRRHIFPNILPSVIVLATLHVGLAILLEASLSYIGIGIPTQQPSLGRMVFDGAPVLERAWWVSVFPGGLILITVVSLNFIGDWLRDRLDPRVQT